MVSPIKQIWKFERRSCDYRRMYGDVAKEIADDIIYQKDISNEGLKKMQNSDVGVIYLHYLKSPVKV